jgi:DNA repair exonuclease SbcCD ATPase subunit
LSPSFADDCETASEFPDQDPMTDHSNDETRLQATETQMRRALGLQSTAAPPGEVAPPPAPAGPRRPARRFMRDGEVAVSVMHRDTAAGTNRLDAARQALEAQTAAREQAEQRLAEAQETIRELRTQLAHARLASDEAVQRAAAEKQASEQALASLRAELLTTQASLQQAEQRQRLPAKPAEERARPAQRVMTGDLLAGIAEVGEAETATPARRRGGRPRKVEQPQPEPDLEFVEWWKPGWRERFR